MKAIKQLVAYYGYSFIIFTDGCEKYWSESEDMSEMAQRMLSILREVIEGCVPLEHVSFVGIWCLKLY